MTRITAEMAAAEIPETARVGDELELTALARIVGIEDDLVDISSVGGPTKVVPGERTVKLLIMSADFLETS